MEIELGVGTVGPCTWIYRRKEKQVMSYVVYVLLLCELQWWLHSCTEPKSFPLLLDIPSREVEICLKESAEESFFFSHLDSLSEQDSNIVNHLEI